jgi:hypothetical protein
MHSRGFRHSAYKAVLRGHPWRMPDSIGMGLDRCPLTCTEAVAFSYVSYSLLELETESVLVQNVV